MSDVLRMKTVILLNIYTVLEFTFLSLFFRCFQNNTGRKVILALIAGFTILCVVNFLFFQNSSVVNTYTRTLEALIVSGYCLQFIFRQSEMDNEGSWGDNALNWLNAGILIYYASGIFFFMTANYLLHAGRFINYITWCLMDTVLIIEYVLIATGFYKWKAQQTISLS